MKTAIMQPYFLPYIGYWQLINAVDQFVIYDNIKYTKKGWINRNRYLINGRDEIFSIPLKSGSDSLSVKERVLSDTYVRHDLLNQLCEAYRKAPNFSRVLPLLESVILNEEANLFRYILHSVETVCSFLNIKTKLIVSSTIPCDHSLKSHERVKAICKCLATSTYINPIGGTELYSKDDFANAGITLEFLRPLPLEYKQFGNPFVPWLSILDVLMFNPPEAIKETLNTGFALE